jgi:LPS-assembly protein
LKLLQSFASVLFLKEKIWSIFSLLIFLPLLSFSETSEKIPLNFEADDRLDYYDEKGIIEGWGNVKLNYEGINLKADYVWFDLKTHDLLAKGNVTLSEKSREFHIEELKYNLKDELMAAQEISSFQKPWYMKGKKLTKVSPDEYLLERGEFTTCNLSPPHYRLTAKRIKVYPGVRLLAYNTFFYIGKIPFMYLPVYRRSLKDVPSGFVIKPGYSSERGAFVLSHYNWYLSEKFNGRWYLDFFNKAGWGKGFDVNFASGTGSGYLYGYHIDERESPTGEPPRERWKLHFRHHQKITEDIREITRLDKLSDGDFTKDYLDDEVLRFLSRSELENHRPEGSLSITMNKPGHTSSIYIRKRVNSFMEVTENLPRVSFDLVERGIPTTSFYYDLDTDFSYLHVSPAGEDVMQMKVRPQLSHKTSLGWLRAKPTIGADGFWYSENEPGEKNIFQGTYKANCALTLANGIWKISDTPGWKEIKKMRHLILPIVTYYYKPEPTIEKEDIYRFCDRIGNEEEFIKVELRNSIEGKTASGEKFRMVDLNLGTSYDRLDEDEPWENIYADLRTDSMRNISWRTLASYNPYIEKLEAVASDFEIEKEKWRTSIGTRLYEPGGEKHTFDLTGEIGANLGTKWKIDLQGRYDLNGENFKVRRVTLHRDLHCWEAQLFWQSEIKDEEKETRIFLAFKLKGIGTEIKTPFIDTF